ncbi:hypothetical protein BT96DRAFT_948231 [Gymnopus androsaceus JB14]|uniref:Uncharacterized protein n=1 Tax=Gymnopus androsaceus JB14 TaxID=1447944 RepID=A0A6A4GPR6_9AGAR|nr:hypothetical protein BT96DRAFT_948231 [Gymnopus androsaceus JB14]
MFSTEDNFRFAWNRWLAAFLNAAEYRVHDVDVTSLYCQIKPYLLDLQKNQVNWESTMFNNTLQSIIQKTLDLWEVRVPVHLNDDVEFVNKWEGVGLTRVSKAQQMQPCKTQKSKKTSRLVNPDHPINGLHLQRIAADEVVLKTCGGGLVSSLLILASGGRKADHYGWYAGIDADNDEGISILFEQAEIMLRAKISAIILETAQAIHPDLVHKIREKAAVCEQVGLAGINFFSCNGYTAPQHFNDDAVQSLCAQFEHIAEQAWRVLILDFCMEQCYLLKTQFLDFGEVLTIQLVGAFTQLFVFVTNYGLNGTSKFGIIIQSE